MFFKKMQLNGNDFIFIESVTQQVDYSKEFVQVICDRRFGVGADGLVVILPSSIADCQMMIYNADGSVANICGNALLSLGRYMLDEGECDRYFDKSESMIEIKIQTLSGMKQIIINKNSEHDLLVEVNMGKVDFGVNHRYFETREDFKVEYLSIGNIHGVIILDDIDKIDEIKKIKRIIEDNGLKNEINIEIIQIVNKNKIKMRVFERGVGETFSCGSGACSALAVAVRRGLCVRDQRVEVNTKGGKHILKYLNSGEILLSGKPQIVCRGDYQRNS